MTTAIAAACTFCDVSPSGVSELSTSEPAGGSAAVGGYDAIQPKGRRRAPSSNTMHEDRHLNQSGRRTAIGGMRDLRRNSSLVDWAIRQHLNYVAAHRFQSRTGDDDYDDAVEAWMKRESRPDRADTRELLSLPTMVRMSEAMSVLDGDVGLLFVDQDTGRLQGIESDRIRDPIVNWSDASRAKDAWYNGVHVNEDSGKPIEYAIHRRRNGYASLEFERMIPAGSFHLHAYRGRFDQYRGISPLLCAYNQFTDVYEAQVYAMVRSKAASMLLAGVKRASDSPLGEKLYQLDENGEIIPSSYKVNLGHGAPMWFDMDPGDELQMLDSDNPGANLQDFWRFVTRVALLALDLPMSLFDSSEGNFFGNKTSWLAYDRSCEEKRANVQQLLDRITMFKYRVAIRSGKFKLPRINGRQLTLGDQPWEWVPRKMPWWRPLEEVTASLKAIGGGLSTPQRVCSENDQGDFYENVDEIEKAMKYAAKKGVPLSFVIDQMTETNVAANRKD